MVLMTISDISSITQVVSSVISLALFSFLLTWVYRILNKQIELLKERLEAQENDNKSLKVELAEFKKKNLFWKSMYDKIVAIIIDNRTCSNNNGNCTIYEKFREQSDKNGIL